MCVAVRTHKLLKNVVYSFHWHEFKLSSVGLGLCDEGVFKTQMKRSFTVTLDFNDSLRNLIVR